MSPESKEAEELGGIHEAERRLRSTGLTVTKRVLGGQEVLIVSRGYGESERDENDRYSSGEYVVSVVSKEQGWGVGFPAPLDICFPELDGLIIFVQAIAAGVDVRDALKSARVAR